MQGDTRLMTTLFWLIPSNETFDGSARSRIRVRAA